MLRSGADRTSEKVELAAELIDALDSRNLHDSKGWTGVATWGQSDTLRPDGTVYVLGQRLLFVRKRNATAIEKTDVEEQGGV